MSANKSIFRVPVYPFLIAVAPVISLYMLNTLELGFYDLVRPALVSLIIAFAAFLVSWLVTRSIRSAAILGSILIISILSYDFAFTTFLTWFGAENPDWNFLLAWLVLTGTVFITLASVLRRSGNSLERVTVVLNSFGIALILLPLIPLLTGIFSLDSGPQSAGDYKAASTPFFDDWIPAGDVNWEEQERPDVYFIILDGYARGDVLESRFDFSNRQFTDWLESKGFFVGSSSHSNYPWTHLSLSSTFNGEYLQTFLRASDLEPHAPKEYRNRYQFFVRVLSDNFIRNSRVHSFFSNAGYRFFLNDSGYAVTRQQSESLTEALLGEMNEFEQELLGRTIFNLFISQPANESPLQLTKHGMIVHSLDQLGSSANQPGPKFVFYHIMSPHPPFCFNEDGGMKSPHPVFDTSGWVEDRVVLPGYQDFFRENYPGDVAGLNSYLKEAVSTIMDMSGGNAVVIIQSDHGSSMELDPHSAAGSDLVERFGILNAIHIPDGFPKDGLQKTMSSVNTFRAVFTNVFNLNLPPLDDRAFFSVGDLNFEEVTNRIQDPSPPPLLLDIP